MDRYSRQRLFEPIGDAGQEQLLNSKVVLIGCGALGTHLAQHLVRAGVGFLRICDRDFVELDNLQRQVLFDEGDVRDNLPKAVAAARRLAAINSTVEVEAHVVDVTAANIQELMEGVDLVLDGTDNFQTRFLINDACVRGAQAWVYGGCVASHGMVLTVIPGETACFACVVPELPAAGSSQTCDTAGVLGPVVGVVAALQAGEALKVLSGSRERLNPGLTRIDLWENQFQSFAVGRNPDCEVCAKRRFRYLEDREGDRTTVLCGRNAVQITPPRGAELDFKEIAKRLSPLGAVQHNEYLLRFEGDGMEVTLFPDGRALIKGTPEPARARAVYAKYIGI